MAFSDFTLADVRPKFGLTLTPGDLFESVSPRDLPQSCREWLCRNGELGSLLNTTKGRCEILIAPLLLAARNLADVVTTLHIGAELTVDAPSGLAGECNYVFSHSPNQFFIDSPIVAVVEPEMNDPVVALPRLIAQMHAARMYDERRTGSSGPIYGVVTSGVAWNFLLLEGERVVFDYRPWSIREAPKILGILLEMLEVPMTSTRVDPSPRPTTPTPTPSPTDTQHV